MRLTIILAISLIFAGCSSIHPDPAECAILGSVAPALGFAPMGAGMMASILGTIIAKDVCQSVSAVMPAPNPAK